MADHQARTVVCRAVDCLNLRAVTPIDSVHETRSLICRAIECSNQKCATLPANTARWAGYGRGGSSLVGNEAHLRGGSVAQIIGHCQADVVGAVIGNDCKTGAGSRGNGQTVAPGSPGIGHSSWVCRFW